MLVGSSISKNKKKKKNSMKAKGGVTKKKIKEAALKGTYFHCGQDGHKRKNCKAYFRVLEEKGIECPIYFRFISH